MPISSAKIIAFALLLASAAPAPAPARATYQRGLPTDPGSTSVSRYGKITFNSSSNGNVTRATFNNPPINLVDAFVVSDLFDFLHSLQPAPNKTTPKVVVFDSANPDWFLGHYDLHNIELPFTQTKADVFNQVIDCTRYILNTTSTAFIAEINGRTIGLGQELSIQMDMRFAGPNALASSFEDSLGLTAAAGGQPFLGPVIGKARAMEYLLAAKAFDGPTGERLGLFNTYYPTAEKLRSEVSALAERIALFPQHSINDTKVTLSLLNPTIASLDDQLARFIPLMYLPEDQATIAKFIEVSGNQTDSKFELGLPESSVQAVRDGVYL
ncbi:ClpP/crotonase-like domain-containing protein [Diplogelasinospora grovesii]|uniref:ClpP/crotonase-like domain-containing protein n=1 Tax=Diplogelasinospora grovesii TaxID=303347 RepID=A0AAN6S9J7_9PEZI|nr:ClpP/crotonase-like domain-containing protein [Diplogelasinospora grovesii]